MREGNQESRGLEGVIDYAINVGMVGTYSILIGCSSLPLISPWPEFLKSFSPLYSGDKQSQATRMKYAFGLMAGGMGVTACSAIVGSIAANIYFLRSIYRRNKHTLEE